MIFSLSKNFSYLWNFFFKPLILLFVILELFFQIIFYFDIKSLKKTILFFNPYCDQAYWNFQGNSSFDKNIYSYHPTLTLIKKKNKDFYDKNLVEDQKIIFYGSSFIDHKYFIQNYKKNINLGIKSYGIDQIYKSYIITKENFKNSNLVIGFLLEDIDRSIFKQRNFPKLKYLKDKDTYKLTNVPVKFEDDISTSNHFYTYRFIKNFIFLISNDYDYKNSECLINEKKEIFKFFINDIISNSKILNQNVIFLTFNFKEDINKSNWRYLFVKDYLNSINANYIDMTQVIKKDIINSSLNVSDYYNNEDFHFSKYAFGLVKKEIDLFKELYK